MKRKDFLQKFSLAAFLGLPALAAKPVTAKETLFEDLFTNKVFDNDNLYFLKDSVYKNDLYAKVQADNLIISERKAFGPWYYIGVYGLVLPFKNSYPKAELENFFLSVYMEVKKYKHVVQTEKGQPIYFFHNKENGHIHLTLMAAFKDHL